MQDHISIHDVLQTIVLGQALDRAVRSLANLVEVLLQISGFPCPQFAKFLFALSFLVNTQALPGVIWHRSYLVSQSRLP